MECDIGSFSSAGLSHQASQTLFGFFVDLLNLAFGNDGNLLCSISFAESHKGPLSHHILVLPREVVIDTVS